MRGPTEDIVSEQQKLRMFFFKASESKENFLVLHFFSKIVLPGNSFMANFLTIFCFLGLLGSTLETRCTAFPSNALDLNAGLVTIEVEII